MMSPIVGSGTQRGASNSVHRVGKSTLWAGSFRMLKMNGAGAIAGSRGVQEQRLQEHKGIRTRGVLESQFK